jgi:hypothetical protein
MTFKARADGINEYREKIDGVPQERISRAIVANVTAHPGDDFGQGPGS